MVAMGACYDSPEQAGLNEDDDDIVGRSALFWFPPLQDYSKQAISSLFNNSKQHHYIDGCGHYNDYNIPHHKFDWIQTSQNHLLVFCMQNHYFSPFCFQLKDNTLTQVNHYENPKALVSLPKVNKETWE